MRNALRRAFASPIVRTMTVAASAAALNALADSLGAISPKVAAAITAVAALWLKARPEESERPASR